MKFFWTRPFHWLNSTQAEGRRTLQEVLALAEKDAGPSADYEVGEEWPWAAAAAPAAPPRPLGLPRYGD